MYDIGLSFEQELKDHFIVATVLWERCHTPNFSCKGITLQEAKKNFPCVIVVQGSNLIQTINAACNRTIEQVIIQRLTPSGTKTPVTLLVTSNKYSNNLILDTEKHRNHWLLTVANRILKGWLGGER